MTIFLEAIQRFVEPQEVSQPKIVLIVGCLGLASNIVGLFLFHDHGHSHGGGGHSHGHAEDPVSNAEEGHSHGIDHDDEQVADETGNIADVLPQNRIASWPQSKSKSTKNGDTSPAGETDSTAVEDLTTSKSGPSYQKHKTSRSRSRTYSSVEDMPVNPSSFRKSIIDQSKLEEIESEEYTDEDEGEADGTANNAESSTNTPDQPLLHKTQGNGYGAIKRRSINHKTHNHRQPKESAGGGHSHDLNMRGVFLHVMGDALGNIGVIATALFIWLTDYSWRFYSDPAISLVITVIILCSAIPLCKAASRILLQAVPAGLSIDDIQEDIQSLPGIVSCHHLHVWQLSDTKLVASLHVQVTFDFKGEGSARYMELARAIRDCLHEYGIHSSTIQPEFCLDPEHDHTASIDDDSHHDSANSQPSNATKSKAASKQGSKATSVQGEDTCLLECGDECGNGKTCCDPGQKDQADDGAQDHDHDHDHGHTH